MAMKDGLLTIQEVEWYANGAGDSVGRVFKYHTQVGRGVEQLSNVLNEIGLNGYRLRRLVGDETHWMVVAERKSSQYEVAFNEKCLQLENEGVRFKNDDGIDMIPPIGVDGRRPW